MAKLEYGFKNDVHIYKCTGIIFKPNVEWLSFIPSGKSKQLIRNLESILKHILLDKKQTNKKGHSTF